jgi:hypothetical protein
MNEHELLSFLIKPLNDENARREFEFVVSGTKWRVRFSRLPKKLAMCGNSFALNYEIVVTTPSGNKEEKV